ncbi:HI0074 family nucleotidyltransferase substrate-binding subunit [Eubacteriaceae bacterium Marseille-Q4139]|nr:HI0074 family nucleotidyltransferase substrate-binding subunit [Eubacteriaceae bacterium Marseille-Q4139]
MKKYENFCRALENLKDIYQYDEPYNNVILSGLVALYEICFEQAWKAMKEIMSAEGIREADTGSPKMIIKSAYKIGMITDEECWLSALVARNNVAHSYNQAVALGIVRETKERYVEMFCDLREVLSKRIS